MESKKKVFVIVPPAAGHVVPVCEIISELCKQRDLDVVFYNDIEYKEHVERTGAKFRHYAKPTFNKVVHKKISEKSNVLPFLANQMIIFTHDLLPQLLKEVEAERPDLIVYDCLFAPAKYLVEVLRDRQEKSKEKNRTKTIMIFPNFVFNEKMFKMMQKEGELVNFGDMFSMIEVFFRQIWLNITFGLTSFDPIAVLGRPDDTLNIVGVTEELQPFRDEFGDKFKFIGPCISRTYDVQLDDELTNLIIEHKSKPDSKLIYISLGMVFDTNLTIYEKTIEAIRVYDLKQPPRRQKAANFKVIISLDEDGLALLNEQVKSEKVKLPPNVLVRANIPQLEVLKKADLFITNAGITSINETIKHSCPIVAIPLAVDQPLVAKRCCDELNVGVRLDAANLQVFEISDAIDEVLSEDKYRNNIEQLSKVSNRYNGAVDGASIILAHLDSSQQQENELDL